MRCCALPSLVLGLALAAAAPATAREAGDPFEAVNRRIHSFNQGVRGHVLGPLAEGYHAVTTPGLRRSVAGVFANLAEPITAASGLLAGDLDRAWNATARFGINTALGWGGVRDRAAEMGYAPRPFAPADAVCSWGVPSGPFLVLPLLGPSTLRDAGAMLATTATLSQILPPELVGAWGAGDMFVGYTRLHQELTRVDAEALDAYALYRSAYLQRRAAVCAPDRERMAALLAAEEEATPAATSPYGHPR
ncbi:MAG TPA: VacJ family lipoprotein [Acetobacteraceae bacterium]|nr:VacJ family lipoprotein [Acetobacteraceae bacterium]